MLSSTVDGFTLQDFHVGSHVGPATQSAQRLALTTTLWDFQAVEGLLLSAQDRRPFRRNCIGEGLASGYHGG
ncbi:hypothetical protein DLJ59_31685 [Micromonospora inaquosa]|uniref:Uncharacterized protein n=1 Tax=Micromonospora inaquosa TaxID=2203716 RepID=A0A3N9W638_9ACTN|nr:hypothetical protein DLJ59_31685 [Micromonospora inaquosa]